MKNKVLIVVGMHRSGTSLVTQWLHRCGLHLGDDFLGPGIGNTDGHFEDVDFLNFQEKVLTDQHLPESGLIENGALEIPPDAKERLRHIIDEKNALNNEWGWKDPRTCLFLPVYQELIPDARYLVVVRDYPSTVSSLINRIFKTIDKKKRRLLDRFFWKHVRGKIRKRKLYKKYAEHYLKVWIHYNKQILSFIGSIPKSSYAVLDYKMLQADDKQMFARLKEDWNFKVNYVDFKKIYKAELLNKRGKIASFIKDKELLSIAENLENHLRSLAHAL